GIFLCIQLFGGSIYSSRSLCSTTDNKNFKISSRGLFCAAVQLLRSGLLRDIVFFEFCGD
ncbi:MAG: hypothetical protein ABJP76_13815, partial [Flavobacteriaceae bacterium]